jgi:hypothetical protein
VLAPERCTAMVEHLRCEGKDYGWRITELRAYDNAIPRRATLQAVTDALGVPAAPSWHPDGAWWMEHRGLACVPSDGSTGGTRLNFLYGKRFDGPV